MSDPIRFLTAFAQTLATMSLYSDGHPARERTIDQAYGALQRLLETDPRPRFSFLGADVIYGEQALRELGDWGWGVRLANAGVQRLEFERGTPREEFERLADEAAAGLEERKASPDAERARLNATRAMRSVLRRVREALPALGRHLDASVKTGVVCSYEPAPGIAVRWEIDEPAEG